MKLAALNRKIKRVFQPLGLVVKKGGIHNPIPDFENIAILELEFPYPVEEGTVAKFKEIEITLNKMDLGPSIYSRDPHLIASKNKVTFLFWFYWDHLPIEYPEVQIPA